MAVTKGKVDAPPIASWGPGQPVAGAPAREPSSPPAGQPGHPALLQSSSRMWSMLAGDDGSDSPTHLESSSLSRVARWTPREATDSRVQPKSQKAPFSSLCSPGVSCPSPCGATPSPLCFPQKHSREKAGFACGPCSRSSRISWGRKAGSWPREGTEADPLLFTPYRELISQKALQTRGAT